jgi:hypothetical protein
MNYHRRILLQRKHIEFSLKVTKEKVKLVLRVASDYYLVRLEN